MTTAEAPTTESDRLCEACGYPNPSPPCPRCGGHLTHPDDGRPVRRGRPNLVEGLIQGAWDYVSSSWEMFNRREYVGKLALPVALNVLVLGILWMAFAFGGHAAIDSLVEGDWGALEWLKAPADWVALAISTLLALGLVLLLAPLVGEVVLAPFLDGLAAATEAAFAGREIAPVKLGFVRSMRLESRAVARILLAQIVLVVPLVLLALTGVGAVLAFVVTGWLSAVAWFDVPAARRGYSLALRRQLLRRNWPLALGFGMATQVGLLVPVFNLLFWAPAATIGASILILRMEKAESSNGASTDRPA